MLVYLPNLPLPEVLGGLTNYLARSVILASRGAGDLVVNFVDRSHQLAAQRKLRWWRVEGRGKRVKPGFFLFG